MPWVNDGNAALLTDLYELTMAASYHANGMEEPATFDLFVRSLPEARNFLVACGLDDALHYLEHLRFDDDACAYLASLGMFRSEFVEFLGSLRFTGDVWAVPEGELVFEGEPILRVTAPLVEAQIVETFLLNCVGYQTMVASKAARVALACDGRTFVDFSPRRDHGADAALRAARASFVAGAAATSNVLAGSTWGIPVTGTMAHSYVMRFEREADAFRTFARDFPDNATLLIDTYDTEQGARTVVDVAAQLAGEDVAIQAVRLDSGDLGELASAVRKILDEGGLHDVRIFASGDLDEYRIAELVGRGAPVDAFGVGTQLGTSGDAPWLGVVYKLVEAGGPRVKLASGKVTLPGKKQVHRRREGGRIRGDIIALHDEDVPGAEPVLEPAMEGGRRTAPPPELGEVKERCARAVAELPDELRGIEPAPAPYPVDRSAGITGLLERLAREHDTR